MGGARPPSQLALKRIDFSATHELRGSGKSCISLWLQTGGDGGDGWRFGNWVRCSGEAPKIPCSPRAWGVKFRKSIQVEARTGSPTSISVLFSSSEDQVDVEAGEVQDPQSKLKSHTIEW